MSENSTTIMPPRPKSPEFFPDNIPHGIRHLKNWVLWKYHFKDGRWTKVPLQTKTLEKPEADGRRHHMAATNNPDTWNYFDIVFETYKYYKVHCHGPSDAIDGVGIILVGKLCGFDFDDCLEDGKILPWAKDWVARLSTYTEVSPSGTGLKSIIRASFDPLVPSHGLDEDTKMPRRQQIRMGDEKVGEIEIYDKSSPRFFTITGNKFEKSRDYINEAQDTFAEIYGEIFGERIANLQKGQEAKRSRSERTGNRAAAMGDADDHEREIIRLALNATNATKFRNLWIGCLSDYNQDQSRADQALCTMLAFWCGADEGLIDQLFRKSGLYREKWERQDYRDRTIGNAIQCCTEFYDWGVTEEEAESLESVITRQPVEPATDDGIIILEEPVIAQEPLQQPQEPAQEQAVAESVELPQEPKRTLQDFLAPYKEDPTFSYLWKGNHRIIDDESRARRILSVKKAMEFLPEGFFRDYLAWALPASDCDSLYHLGGALTVAGTVMNRKVSMEFGGGEIHPNFWVGLLGDSSVARKSTAKNIADRALTAFGTDCVQSEGFTFESLLKDLGFIAKTDPDDPFDNPVSALRQRCKNDEEHARMTKVDYTKGVGVFMVDEIGGWLKTLDKQQNQGLKETITSWYDCPRDWTKSTKTQGVYYVYRPCVSILGCSTTSWLQTNVQEHDLLGGFLPRWLFFTSKTKDYLASVPDPHDNTQQQKVMDGLKRMSKRWGCLTLEYGSPAFMAYHNWRINADKDAEKNGDHAATSWVNRVAAYALKIALVFQISIDDSDTIGEEAMTRALRLADYLIAQLKEVLEEVSFEEDGSKIQKLEKFIRAGGKEGKRHSECLKYMKTKANLFKPWVDTLEQRQRIMVENEGKPGPNGKPQIRYIALT